MTAVLIEISEQDADPARLDQLTYQLLRDLRRVGLSAERQVIQAPPASKSGAALAIATLIIGMAGTPAASALVNGIFGWLGPRRSSIKIICGDKSVELSAVTEPDKERLFEWLQTCGEKIESATPESPEGGRCS